MLALTPTAAEAVEAIVTQPDAPEGAVLRISSEEGEPDASGEETRDLQLAVVEAPEAEDVRVQGIAISVEPETLGFLDDKVLDAEISDEGVRFRLFLQPPEGFDAHDHEGHDHDDEAHAHEPSVDDPPSPNGSGPTT